MDYISVRQILDDLLADDMMKGCSLERVVKYAVEFIKVIGMPPVFDSKVAKVDIKDYRGELPCDFYKVIQVKDPKGFAYISSEGYFIITFTKIANDLAKNISHSSSPKPKAKRKNLNTSCKTAIYQFDKFDDYTNFCTYLDNLNFQNIKGFAKKISLYEFEKKYFLVFNEINIGHKNISFLYTSISEFGKLVSNSKNFESKLIEYGKTIFKNNALQNGIIFFLNS